MKFAHLADCHIGSWRDPKLRDISTIAFIKTIDKCIEEKVDFVLIAGDLFNTSLPALDNLKLTVSKLKQLKDLDIPTYIIAGSHDFSPSGKTILDVLEEAGLLINVVKGEEIEGKLKLNFTTDNKTQAKITGLFGKKGSLEKAYYENLIKENLEQENGYKIFIFHSALTEFKPIDLKDMESHPISLLPKRFNYYAGGHPHYIFQKQEEDYGLISYPGPLFPNSFAELEKLERGGFYIAETTEVQSENSSEGDHERECRLNNSQAQTPTQPIKTKITWHPIQIYNIEKIRIDCNNKTPEQIEEEIKNQVKDNEFNNTIVLIRLFGTLSSGKPSDINFREIYEIIYNKSAYFVMKNTNALTTKEFEEVKIDIKSVEDIESAIIKEHLGQIKVNSFTAEKEELLTKELIRILSQEKQDSTKLDFENRIKEEVSKTLEIEMSEIFHPV
ncbi:DNA repair exonuclease [Candidatus Woesearchaeota archaeon]|nr:DNA repair exonuclease [Candidatus Woesearchaeota archaeon]